MLPVLLLFCKMLSSADSGAALTVDPWLWVQVSVTEEEDEFQLVVTACLSVLILGCETKLDAALLQMTRMPWASLEAV
jgi:hypothetical protein